MTNVFPAFWFRSPYLFGTIWPACVDMSGLSRLLTALCTLINVTFHNAEEEIVVDLSRMQSSFTATSSPTEFSYL